MSLNNGIILRKMGVVQAVIANYYSLLYYGLRKAGEKEKVNRE